MSTNTTPRTLADLKAAVEHNEARRAAHNAAGIACDGECHFGDTITPCPDAITFDDLNVGEPEAPAEPDVISKVTPPIALSFEAFAEKLLSLHCSAYDTKTGSDAELAAWWPVATRAEALSYTYTADGTNGAPIGTVFTLLIDTDAAAFLLLTETPSDAQAEEIARELGMAHGMDAYNEARGCSTERPEPCGHHCDSTCPRCGDE